MTYVATTGIWASENITACLGCEELQPSSTKDCTVPGNKYTFENTADVGNTLQANYTENQVTRKGVIAHLSKHNT